jgi:poly-gamma-glutamate capsule biosynthesis protein CapA/YwtB (metallophosphatase superfamily)
MRSISVKIGIAAAALVGAFCLAGVARAPYSLIPQEPTVTVLFVGDLMLDRGVARRARDLVQPTDIVADMRPLVAQADLMVLNLEGTITFNESIAARDNTILRFTFAPALAQAVLGALGADAVSLANNHALDFYASGYDETLSYLERWGVAHFGHPLNARDLSTALTARGARVCLVGYHELYDPSTAAVLEEIVRVRPACDYLVVMAHWGIEYEHEPTEAQVVEAHAFVDAGADLVVGAHPHVVQSHEVYRGKAIFYSLGNFVFDQDFSIDTTRGLALIVEFRGTRTTITPVPLSIVESRPIPGPALDSLVLP